jgi:hypothetical protein
VQTNAQSSYGSREATGSGSPTRKWTRSHQLHQPDRQAKSHAASAPTDDATHRRAPTHRTTAGSSRASKHNTQFPCNHIEPASEPQRNHARWKQKQSTHAPGERQERRWIRRGREGGGRHRCAAPRRAVFEFAELLIGGGRERRRAEGGEEGVGGRRVKTARQRQRQRRGEGNESEMEKRQKAIGGPSRIRKEREGEEPRTCGPTWQREKTKAERDLPLTAAAALLRCLCQECVA